MRDDGRLRDVRLHAVPTRERNALWREPKDERAPYEESGEGGLSLHTSLLGCQGWRVFTTKVGTELLR